MQQSFSSRGDYAQEMAVSQCRKAVERRGGVTTKNTEGTKDTEKERHPLFTADDADNPDRADENGPWMARMGAATLFPGDSGV